MFLAKTSTVDGHSHFLGFSGWGQCLIVLLAGLSSVGGGAEGFIDDGFHPFFGGQFCRRL